MITIRRVLYKSKRLKDGTHPVMFRLSQQGSMKYFSTGHSLHPDQWDALEGMPNRNYRNSTQLKRKLFTIELRLEDIISDFEAIGEYYTIENVLKQFSGERANKKVLEYFDECVERLMAIDKEGNARAYKYAKNSLKKYLNGKDIRFEQLNYGRVKQYEEYLIQRGLVTNSVSVQLRTLKALYNKAIREGVVQEKFYPFKDFKIKSEATRKRALRMQEIQQIEDAQFGEREETLGWARDLFMFSFYCQGMSFVDMAHLKWTDIYNGRIQYRRSKTGINYNIGIHLKLESLIEKWKEQSTTDFVLPKVFKTGVCPKMYRSHLRWYNRLLRRMGEELGLSLRLTSYVSRHSWATVAKRKGVPIAMISNGLGHKTERTTVVYLDAFENDDVDRVNRLVAGLN